MSANSDMAGNVPSESGQFRRLSVVSLMSNNNMNTWKAYLQYIPTAVTAITYKIAFASALTIGVP